MLANSCYHAHTLKCSFSPSVVHHTQPELQKEERHEEVCWTLETRRKGARLSPLYSFE